MTVLAASRVVTPDGVLAPGAIEVAEGRIAAVAPIRGPAPDRVLAPGLIDLQVNGVGEIDVAEATLGDMARIDPLLAAQGTTTWLPTLVSAPLDSYAAPLGVIAAASERPGPRPEIAGAHLEGPFLGRRPGAHDPEAIVAPDLDWVADLPPVVAMMTLGPELSGADRLIGALRARGITVALGHSGATVEEALAAIGAGARVVTHGFNAMSGLDHRAPGLVGAMLSDDRVTVTVIADGHHVHPTVLAVAFRCKPRGRIALVTDSVAVGAGRLGGRSLHLVDGAPRDADGRLAGSTLTLDAALAFAVQRVGVSVTDAVRAASTTPAQVLGLHDRGALSVGRRADIVALDPVTLRCTETWVGGQQIHG